MREGRKKQGVIRPARVPKENHMLSTQTRDLRKKFPLHRYFLESASGY